jgi:hypothetical protein
MKTFIKIFIFFISSLTVLSFTLLGENPKRISHQLSPTETMILSSRKMDGNNISTWYRNNGSFNRDPVTGNAGFQWPKGAGAAYTIRYASGMWIAAKVNDSLRIAVAQYDYEYLPGFIDNNGNPNGKDDPNYRVYVINKDDTLSPDYQNWPVNQGAYTNENEKPYLLGNQSMWMVYTDGYSEAHNNTAGSTPPLKAQILNYSWCYNVNSFLKDVIFSEYRIINRSNHTWDSTFFSFWTDDDIGSIASNDASGSDSTINLSYTFNFGSNGPPYGTQSPAVGFALIRGPQLYTGDPNDIDSFYSPPGSFNLIMKEGYKKLNLTSSLIFFGGGFGDPHTSSQTWNAVRGLIPQNGNQINNPITGKVTKFVFSGDPESQTGWLQTDGRDTRSLMSAGPVTVIPGDTQRIVVAQIVAQGINNRNSVTLLKEYAQITKQIYDENFANVVSVSDLNQNIPERFYLYQNYPNPFNPETKIRFDIKQTSNIVLKVYDVSGKLISTLIDNEKISPGAKQVTFNAAGLSSGVYFYTLEADNFKVTKKMILVR